MTEAEYKTRYIEEMANQSALNQEEAEANYDASYGCDEGLLEEALERGTPEEDVEEEIHAWDN
jgi:hypothetical protein